MTTASIMAHYLDLLLSFFSATAIVLVAASVGRKVVKHLLPPGSPLSVQFAFGAAAGLGLISYLTLFAGLAGFVGPGSGAAILFLLLAVSWHDMTLLLRRAFGKLHETRDYQLSPAGAAVLMLTGSFFMIILLGACAPPFYYDGLVYHLTVPKLHLIRGAVGYIPENVHAQFPSVVQMLYLMALQINDDITVKLLNLEIGILAALAIFLFGKTFCDRRTGFWAAAFFLTTEAVAMTLTRVMIDAGVVLFTFMSFFAIALWIGKEAGSGAPWSSRACSGDSASAPSTPPSGSG